MRRRGRGHRLRLPGDARPGRRGRDRLAVVPELRPRPPEARRGARSASRCATIAIDLEAILAAITPRTKLVFVAAPNNPTGTTSTRAELDAYFARVPPHVLTVVDQAYFEYVDDPDYPDAIEEYIEGRAPRARPAHVLEDLRPRRAAGRLRRRPAGRDHRDREGATRVRRHLRRPGGGAREPRRRRGDRAQAPREPRGDGAARERAPRARPRARRARGRELRLRAGRRTRTR